METNNKIDVHSQELSTSPTADNSPPYTEKSILTSLGIDSGSFAAAAECENVANVIRKRSGVHGDAFENLTDIASRWSRYLTKKLGVTVSLDVADVGYMMVEMKLSRVTYGDGAEIDHPCDIQGYSAIWTAFLRAKREASKTSN